MIKCSFFGNKDFSATERALVREFDGYLSSVERGEIDVFTSEGLYRIPYKTRWSPEYRKSMIGKMYGVEEYLKKSSRSGVVTLLTLTGYQGGELSRDVKGRVVSRLELFAEMRRGWELLSSLIRRVSKGLEYVWVMEPHKSGYPHMHVAIFGYVPKELQDRLCWLWSEKYQIGSAEHGIDFSVKSVKESIQSVRNYLMKYITKGIGGEGKRTWSAEEWVYHALARKYHHRYIGMSMSISRYCTARRLRYRYGRRLSERCGEYVGLPELPMDKEGLLTAISEYRYCPGEGPPKEGRWSCAFVNDRGTVSFVRRSGNIPVEDVDWVNGTLGKWVGYEDTFLRIPDRGYYDIAPVSDQVMFNGRRC